MNDPVEQNINELQAEIRAVRRVRLESKLADSAGYWKSVTDLKRLAREDQDFVAHMQGGIALAEAYVNHPSNRGWD